MKNIIMNNWRSSLTGVALIVSSATQIHHVGDLSNQAILGGLLGGLGLLFAADGSKKAAQ